jgi:hypothetical protein
MILGMTPLTFVHVLLSLVGIFAGFIVMFGMFAAKRLDGWTSLFLLTTVLTSVTGFFFPFHKLLPSHIIGIISLVMLLLAILARYSFHLAGAWRKTYVAAAMISLYLNVFVLIVQAFEKAPALHAIAPTLNAPAFLVTQVVVMVIFIVFTVIAAKKFRSE